MIKSNQEKYENVKTYWEKVADTKWGAYISDIERRAILNAHTICKGPKVALEIGCEGGRWSKILADLGWKMICTDIDEGALRICRERIPAANCILVNQDDCELACSSESVDLVLCVEVFPVIQALWFASETFRVLKDKGLLVGVFLNFLSFRGLFGYMKASYINGFKHYKLSYPHWKRKFLNTGYRMLYEEGFCWFPFKRDSDSGLIPYFTKLEKKC